MSQFRRALTFAGGALLVLLLVLALAFGLLQTPPGRAWLGAALGHALADPGERVTVVGLKGLIPFDMSVSLIEIDDAQGPRVVVADAAVSIAAGDLLAGRLTVRRFRAAEITVARPSVTPLKLSLSMVLHPPLPVRLETVRIDRLSLGAALVGEPVAAMLDASAAFGGGQAAADLRLDRVDATPGRVRLHLALGGTPPVLDVAADVEEPSGRLLADALGRTEPLPVALHLAGQGPLATWQGNLSFHAGSEAALDAAFRIRRDGGYHFDATGNAHLAALMPAKLQPLFDGRLDFAAALEVSPDRLALSQLTLADHNLRFSASGSVARASEALNGKARLELPDLAALAPLTGEAGTGAASLSLALGGTACAPVARATLDGRALSLAGARINTAAATLDLRAAGPPLDAATPIDMSASGDFRGITLAAGPLPGRLGDRLDWRLGARFDRGATRVALHELALDDAGSSLVVHAAGGDGSIGGDAMLHVPDIGRFAGAATSGDIALAAVFHGRTDGSATAVLSGTLNAPHSGEDPLDRLLGDKAEIAATLRRKADGALAIDDFHVKGANAELTAAAQRAIDGRIDANYRLALPRLAALAPTLAGTAAVAGELSGPGDAPSAGMTLSAHGVRAGTIRIDRLDAKLAIDDVAKPVGKVTARFSGHGLQGTASAEGALAGETLRLSRIRLAAAGTTLEGDLALKLRRRRIDGTLSGKAADLAPWSGLVGTPLAGSAAFTARLGAADEQSATLTLDGHTLSLGGIRLGRAHATARLAGLMAAPAGRVALDVEQAMLGKASVAKLSLQGASLRPGRFSLDAQASGRASEPFTVSSTATLTLDHDRVALRVAQLSGTLGKAPLLLHGPLLLTRRGGDFAFSDLDLGFGSGRLSGDGSIKGTALALRLSGKDLPVHDLAELGGQSDVSGVLGFEATLAGSRARPEGKLVIDGEELRLAASRTDLAPLSVVVSADWRDGAVTAKGRLAGPHGAALGFTGRAPLTLDAASLAPRVPPQGALALHLEGGGELANLADLVPLGEDRFAGAFSIDVSVGGTVASPEASGRLSVHNGRYESLFWGTTLAGVDFDLIGNHTRLVLQNFRASDGAKGSLTLSGAVDLAAPTGPAFDFAGKFVHFRAVQRDEATATMSGEVSLAGTLAAPRLGARLTIERAELRIPKQLPENVQPIPVTVINSATGQVLSSPEPSQPRVSLLSLALDVSVEMPGQVFVRGRGLDSEWRGRVHVIGTTAEPSITGKLEVVHGTYDFLGKTANLTSGTITFLGGKRIDPEINIEAQASSTDVIAIIKITGTATRPSIKLTSDPPLPQDEVLARVLFGTTVSKITPAQGFELAQAATALATGGDPGVLDRIRQGLGLDRLSLTSASATNPLSNVTMPTTPAGVPSAFPTAGIGSAPTPVGASSSGTASTAVSAGKYVANGVYVGVTQGISAGSSAAEVQIDVTPHISIDTTAGGQTAGTGVGLYWKLDY
jgi:translocation and assembly module TamB